MRIIQLLTRLLVASYVREAKRQRALAKKELANAQVFSDNITAMQGEIVQLDADIETEVERRVSARIAAVGYDKSADRILDKAGEVERFLKGGL
ncbi:hypothetical protein HOU66_gp12 [Pectobacterium phage Arno160]|uniref:Uncharacterized protein n=1 Tax=Pectobacterium phage Arno160 TaxID=2488835 RepID=A0A3G8F1V0_9CAUD|nr:hypothetical protein HOU66_gp12 [Pectobacterium phage Arno160]AZF88074.1 hypothetical protein Arno160_gp12 [Pectobacterium phage Arno160]